ncbi:ABC transporter permease subunit [Natronolimnohabitans innermongolicus]|uniref:ABC transporter n=1 Tax=Natronolimnohabitans innermongolicus JCM 12255 TaxID=1227499 RepID=L9X059_9EURY|nr:ABC transporter permease subunit [Natronolimnohabitans innermongolicus]ELY54841.1 ABC transporter [Natronolimnohabitans innermongolicus JCM 12255]
MSTLTVAKKDYHDAIRSRELWVLMALFVLFLPVVALYDVTSGTSVDDGLPIGTLFSMVFVMTVLAPVTALLVSIKSIVRERRLGTIKFLLAFPYTRGEVYVGKFLGRLAVFATAVLVGYVPAFLILFFGISDFAVGPFVGMLVVILFFGLIFVVVGYAASALTTSETVASVAGFALFFLVYSWQSVFSLLNWWLGLVDGNAETFIHRFGLTAVSEDIVNAVASIWDSDIDSASVAVSNGGDVPFYLQHWFAFVVLGVWIGLPLALGYWRFRRAEL